MISRSELEDLIDEHGHYLSTLEDKARLDAALDEIYATATDEAKRLEWALRNACLAMVEDGDSVGLFLNASDEKDTAFAIVAECTGEDGDEPLTAEDAPWLTVDQRARLNGTAPEVNGSVTDLAALRAAIDSVRT